MAKYVPPNERQIECAWCGQTMCAKQMDSHWIRYRKGGDGYPKHSPNAFAVKFYEIFQWDNKRERAI